MTQEEAVVKAQDNAAVADYFYRKMQDIVYLACANGKITKEEEDEVEHLAGCAAAHFNSSLSYLRGDFTHSS